MILLDLFLGFLKVGCFAFGGGFGAIPLIRDIVLGYGWVSEESLNYMIAVSESTPGPIMVNVATYVGSSQAGLPGSVIATAAVVLPSFLIILLVMAALKNVLQHPYVQAMLRGMKPCIGGIILATGATMLLKSCTASGAPDFRAILLALLLGVLYFRKPKNGKKISPIALICISAVLGMVVYGI